MNWLTVLVKICYDLTALRLSSDSVPFLIICSASAIILINGISVFSYGIAYFGPRPRNTWMSFEIDFDDIFTKFLFSSSFLFLDIVTCCLCRSLNLLISLLSFFSFHYWQIHTRMYLVSKLVASRRLRSSCKWLPNFHLNLSWYVIRLTHFWNLIYLKFYWL